MLKKMHTRISVTLS